MSMITKYVSEAARFFRGRMGARLLLVLGCVICVAIFAPYVDKVDITADGETQTYITLRTNPQEIMSQYGLTLDTQDSYRVITDDSEDTTGIEILRAFEISITDAGVPYKVELAEGTVAEALAMAGVALPDSDDVINCSPDAAVYAYMNITIDRVSYDEKTTYEVIDYKTVKRETSSLYKGQTRTFTKGKNGEKVKVTRTKYVNGAAVSSEVISENVTVQAVNEVIEVGTAVSTTKKPTTTTKASGGVLSTKQGTTSVTPGSGKFIDNNGREVAYSKVLTGKGTAYTAPAGAKTATGKLAQVGLVAVDPNVIPFGTNLYIVSADGKHVYGYALAADTGGALKRGEALVDLYYDTESQCLAFGRRDVVVYVLA